ncbi:MAG TPA: HAD-IA family hydrolase [Bryobacteraceae bacterium]|nr:HAD-IA family hydrolase [Bryobacteraceae bacterium]
MHLLIFDLDGTLVDSKQDLIDSVNATRGYMNMAPLPGPTVAKYVGRGAMALIQSALGEAAPAEQVEKAHAFFIQYYGEHMLDKTVLYDGVRESLDALRERGHLLAVLTNKPVRFSERMMDRLGLGRHFLRIYGGNSFEPKKKPDPVGIHALISESSIPGERTIMVGDSSVDIRTARNAGVRSCGVTWGFQPETFEQEPPDFTIDHMRQLHEYLLANPR